MANDAEPALETAIQAVMEADWDEEDDESIFSYIAKREYPHGERKGVEVVDDGSTGGRCLYIWNAEAVGCDQLGVKRYGGLLGEDMVR